MDKNLASASGMWRHANCPGNRILERSLRDRGFLSHGGDTTPEATIGTRIHAALEGLPEELELDEEEVKDRCERLAMEAFRQFFGTKIAASTIYEQRFTYRINEVPMFTGKPDRVYFGPNDAALNINFKTGRKESIESHLNLQLRTEVVLIKHNNPYLIEVAATIVEPLVDSKPELVIYDERDLEEAEKEILGIVDKTEWVTDRKAGKWCEHCPCRAFCPEAKQLALYEPLYVYTKPLPEGEEGATVLEQIEIAYSVLDKIWEAYKTIVKTKLNAIPGWHISDGRSYRYIRDIPRAEDIASRELDLDLTDLVETKLPIKKFEEAIAKATKLKGKALNEKINDLFWQVISKTEPGEGSLERIPKRLLK